MTAFPLGILIKKKGDRMATISDQKFKALIRLLDDEDPDVSQQVWAELLAMGNEGVERLEAEWEISKDPVVQSILEDTIHRLQMQEVARELLEWRRGGGKDLLMGWFLVSRIQFPDLEFELFRKEFNRLVNKAWLELDTSASPFDQIKVLNHIIFRMEGYGPNNARPQHPNNNFLNYLIEQQQGNVMSLSLLYLIIAQQLDMPVGGVLLPGYFILYYNDRKDPFYIDVYNGGKTFNRERLKNYLEQVKVEPKASYFKPTSNIYIILSLLNNLIVDFDRTGKQDRVDDIKALLEAIDIHF